MSYDQYKLATPPSFEETIEIKECNDCCDSFNSDEMEYVYQPGKKLKSGVFIVAGHVWLCNECKTKTT